MPKFAIVLLTILIIMIIALIVLYFVGKRAPKMLRRSKLPIVKAKVGPKVMTLICDGQIFDSVPVKKEVKATVSGLYITAVKGMRGPIEAPAKKKKGFMAKLKEKAGK